MIERWRNIEGFENKYQISNTGKVKSLKYNNTNKEKLMQPRINKRGIYTVNLWKNNKAYQYSVALLVARHFLKKKDEKDVVIHIGDKFDDNVKNLKYVSKSEARWKERHKEAKNEQLERIYTSGQIREYKKIAEKNGISIHQLYKRLYEGWEIEDASMISIKRKEHILKKKLYKYQGELYSINQLAKMSNGISESALRKRIARKWSIDEAINIPLNKYRRVGVK